MGGAYGVGHLSPRPAGDAFRSLALELPGAEERDHLGSPSFRVAGKIFAQLSTDETAGLVKLPLIEQDACFAADPARFSLPEHWSKFGWTYVRLGGAEVPELRRLLDISWRLVAPKKLVRACMPIGRQA